MTVLNLYEHTRLGRQELYADILDEIEGALWTREMIDATRLDPNRDQLPRFKRVVVAVDPAVTANKRSNETGIVAIGQTYKNHAVVLEDASGQYSPDGWADRAIKAYKQWHATRIVAENNQGGDMVEAVFRSRPDGALLPIKLVTATKGKIVRAEPVAALYEQRKIGHWGIFPKLEDQLCEFTGDDSTEESPDRLDALVWGLTELLLTGRSVPYVAVSGATAPSYWSPPGSGSDSSVTATDFITMS